VWHWALGTGHGAGIRQAMTSRAGGSPLGDSQSQRGSHLVPLSRTLLSVNVVEIGDVEIDRNSGVED